MATQDPVATLLQTALTSAYDTVEVRTRLSPPIVLRTTDFFEGGKGNAFIKFLAPSIVIQGRAGTTTIAPYGTPDPLTGVMGLAMASLALIGIGFVLGRATA